MDKNLRTRPAPVALTLVPSSAVPPAKSPLNINGAFRDFEDAFARMM
jgi:hypothetical protein